MARERIPKQMLIEYLEQNVNIRLQMFEHTHNQKYIEEIDKNLETIDSLIGEEALDYMPIRKSVSA